MAIGDTWETINTYAFVAGETSITADYGNDVVNNLQYLYKIGRASWVCRVVPCKSMSMLVCLLPD